MGNNIDRGLRYNEGKIRYDLIPTFANEQFAKVLTEGAKKYADNNWKLGMRWSKVLASLKRHIAAYESGEDYDKEDGILHTAHMICNTMFLTEYYKIYPQGDDRQHSYLTMPKIGLDIDDVICDFVPAFMNRYGLKEPHNWCWSYKTEDYFKQLTDNPEELKNFYLSLKPKTNPDTIPFEPHCYLTSRSVPIEITKQWIEENGFSCKPIYTVPFNTSKIDIAKESGIDVFVDDKFENFVELNNAGISCFLLDAPWNQRYDVGYKRIKTLNELKFI